MGQDQDAGKVSRSFDEWNLVDKDIRAFFNLTADWATRRYEEIWNESRVVDTSADSEDGDFYEIDHEQFEDKVYGLWPGDYKWILSAAVIREAE